MKTEQRARIHELFIEALHLSPPDRAALLDERCAGDATLRAEVESLLVHDQLAAPGFLQPPEHDLRIRRTTAPIEDDPLIGQQVGRYQIKEVIAAGGMGTVYLAEQARPRRSVALKMMRTGLGSRSAVRRFEYESEILARLHHPNIAQVYEAGTFVPSREVGTFTLSPSPGDGSRTVRPARGLPYFAMEYLPDAKTITQYANENKLSMRDRLTLFATVCEAVHYGHQKGIIHRDLKPANILVADEQSRGRPSPRLCRGTGRMPLKTDHDAKAQRAGDAKPKGPLASARRPDLSPQAQVKIIDFGVARATDSDVAVTTMGTDVGQLLGTLQYMSPEQCDADPHDLDTRSDVYSLGVVLYELLTGSRPYHASSKSIYQATRTIKEQEPRRPSAINVKLRGDVETIVLKALEKDREKRYQSAVGLAMDIRRYLAGDPIAARPPTAWTRFCHFVSRHPIAATTAMCLTIVILTLAATVTAVWLHNGRPHRIVRVRNGVVLEQNDIQEADEARLLAYGGQSLKTWGEPERSISFAALVDRPEEFGGGRLAMIGYSSRESGPYRRTLCAYDVDVDLDNPAWRQQVKRDDIPADLLAKGRGPGMSAVYLLLVADIFTEVPGNELIVVHQHGIHSQCAIRIYDIHGNLLYQIWQDGGISARPYWMSDAGLLVFLGGDEELKLHDPRFSRLRSAFATVLFAIRPKLNLVTTEYLRRFPGDGPLDPVWYKVLVPPDVRDRNTLLRTEIRSSEQEGRQDRFVLFEMVYVLSDGGQGSIWWSTDEFGEYVAESRGLSDKYQFDQEKETPELPNPEDIGFEDIRDFTSTSKPADG